MVEKDKKKSWFRKHWVLTTMLILAFFILIGAITSPGGSTSKTSSNKSVYNSQNKTSGYSVEDCMNVCNGYCLQAQVSVCQTNCEGIYGKPSSSLDRYVNKVKNITSSLNCP